MAFSNFHYFEMKQYSRFLLCDYFGRRKSLICGFTGGSTSSLHLETSGEKEQNILLVRSVNTYCQFCGFYSTLTIPLAALLFPSFCLTDNYSCIGIPDMWQCMNNCHSDKKRDPICQICQIIGQCWVFIGSVIGSISSFIGPVPQNRSLVGKLAEYQVLHSITLDNIV